MKNLGAHSWREWWQLAKAAASAWSDDYAPSMGAALSYYSVFSMAPLLVIVIAIAGLVFGAGHWWSGALVGWEILLQVVNLVLGFALTTGVFAMIFKLMPRVDVRWHDVWLGATTTAVLFTVGRFLIGLYIGKSGIASGFGAAGSVAVIFVWVYYSAQIFLLGAEFT